MEECNICGRKFEYGDRWSPMLKDHVWRKVLDKFGISRETEKRKYWLFSKLYDLKKCAVGEEEEAIDNLMRRPIFHTMICTDCMEKALGRKLTLDDTNRSPFNSEFEREYFKKEDEKAQILILE